MSTDEIKYPRFISNAPLGDDLFEGKSQKIIADCISELLLNDDSCKVIGLDGQWGSGKSNLVKMVESSISDKYYTFVYDAWGHQEDLQRRSILEELTESLTSPVLSEDSKIIKEPALNSVKWKKNKLKNLLAKTREVETKSIPSLGIGIILVGLVLVLTPLFSIIIDAIPEEYLWYRLGVVALPFICLISYFFVCWWREYKKHTHKERKQRRSLRKERKTLRKNADDKKPYPRYGTLSLKETLTQFFYIYQGKQKEDTTYETISEDEPSVKKFRDWMSEISSDLGESKLLLVFDNMDRLPPKKVQELWSSIHTFFAETAYPNIRVIVPFDRAHIKTAFKIDGQAECYGDDFINKTFNVVFRVSLPILSDWKNYFKLKWDEALNDIDGEEYNRILQIFDVFCQNVTPREIVAFINEYVSIKLACQKYNIPGRYIALFIIAKDQILSKHNDEILEPSYLGGLSFIYSNDENLPKYIASLTYQIDPENAIQIAYTKTLSNALDNNDIDTVLAISKVREFTDILVNILPNLNNYENVVLALDKVPEDAFTTNYQYQSIWDDIYAILIKGEAEGQIIKPYQEILLSKVSEKKKYVQKILAGFISGEDFSSTDYYESINKINSQIKDEYGFTVFSLMRTKQTSVEDFISLVNLAEKEYSKYKITCPVKEIDEYLSGLTVEALEDISFVPFYNETDKKKLEKYVESLKEKLGESEDDAEKLEVVLNRYKEMERPLTKSISDKEVYNHFSNLDEDSEVYYDAIAMRLARQNKFTTSYVSYFADILDSDDDDLAEKIASRIEYYISFGDYLIGLELFSKHALYASVAKKLIEGYYGVSSATVSSLIFKFSEIVKWSGVSHGELLRRLNGWSRFIKSITIENVNKVPISFFITAFPNKNNYEIATHTIKTALEYLDSLNEEQWAEVLQTSNSYDLKLSNTLDYTISQAAFDAVKSTLKSVALGEISVPDKEEWNGIIDRIEISKKSLVGTFNTVRDAIIRQDNMTPEMFLFFGDWLFKYAHLNKKEESLRTIFPSTVLDNEECLNIIIENKEKMPTIIDKAKDEKADFIDKVLSLKSSHRNKKYQNFLEFLGIDKQKRSRKKRKKE